MVEPDFLACFTERSCHGAAAYSTLLLSWLQNRPDNTAYACGPTDRSDLPELAKDVKVDARAAEAIIAQIGGLSPEYLGVNNGQATVVARQACYLPVGSGDPVIAKLEPGLYVGAGHSCWGITNGEIRAGRC